MTRRSTKTAGEHRWIAHRRYVVPKGNAALFGYYLRDLFIPHSRRDLAWAALGRWSPEGALMTLPLVGGARSPAHADVSAEAVARVLREIGVAGDRLPPMIRLSDHDHSSRGKTIFFLFPDGARTPAVLAKATNVARHREELSKEQDLLRTLRQQLPEAFRRSIAEPLGHGEDEGVSVAVETFVGGRSIYQQLRNSWRPAPLVPRHFQLAGAWLRGFQKALGARTVQVDARVIDAHVLKPFEMLTALLPQSSAVARLMDETRRRASKVMGGDLPLVPRHGDFWAGNILLDHHEVRVIDWDGFQSASNPFHDWFHFAATYGLAFPWQLGRWKQPASAFRSSFGDGGPMTTLVRRYLLHAARELGTPAPFLDLFLPVYLAEQVLAEARSGLSVLSGGAPGQWLSLLELYASNLESFRLAEGNTRD